MTNVIHATKRAFTWSVVVLTILWSMGVAAFVPAAALAAEADLEPGDLYTVEGDTAVFLVTEDMEAMYFPNSEVYHTWFSDFSGINRLDSADFELADQPGVNFRPGSRLVKITTNPRVYAVGPNNMLHWVTDGAIAQALYGANWASLVRDVHVYHWSNYEFGTDLDEAMPHDGQLIRVGAAGDVWYVWGGERHMVDGTLSKAAAGDVRTVSAEVADTLEDSGETVTPSDVLSNPSQMSESANEEPGDDEEPADDEEEMGGDLTVSLHAGTPDAALVPKDATHVMYLSFNVRAGSEGGLVDSISFKRYGLGDDANFDSVWLEVDGLSVSNEQSVNSDDTVSLHPNYTIGANQTVRFDLVANLSDADSSNQDGFQIVDADMVDANGGEVSGSFPIRGSLMNYSNFEIASVTIDEKGAADEIEIGDEQEIIGEFELDFNSPSEEEGEFLTLRLKQEGTANMGSLANIQLYEDGEVVSKKTAVWGDYVTFWVADDEQSMEDGESRSFEVRGDLTDGENDETIIFELEDNRDLHVREVNGYGSSVTNNLDGAAANQLETYTVDAGQFTVSLDASSPANENYSPDTQDITALVARVDLGQDISVDGLKVYLHTDSDNTQDANTTAGVLSAINADIERAELFKNDKRIGSALTTVTASEVVADGNIDEDEFYYDFNSSFELADDDLLTLVIDLESDADDAATYKFEFSATNGEADFSDPEYIGSGDNVPAAERTGSAIGRFVTISDADLTIVRNDGYSSGETFIGGTDEALLFQFVIDAGNASDIRVQTLSFTSDLDTVDDGYLENNYSKFTNCFLSADDGATAIQNQTEDMSNAGALSFNNLRFDVESSSQEEVGLYCNLQTGLGATTGANFTLDVSASDFDDAEGQDIADADVNGAADVVSQNLTFATTGILTVGVDGDTADADIIVADAQDADGVMLGSWLLEAENDAIEVTNLHFANLNAAGSATSTASDARVAGYDLIVDGEVVDSAQPSSGVFEFDIDSEASRIEVPKDDTVVVSVRARFNEINDETQTQAVFRLSLYAVEAQSAGPGTDLAAGVGLIAAGGQTLTATAAAGDAPTALEAETLVAYKSVPTLATVALTTSPLANDTRDIYKFSVKADANGAVSWGQIVLQVAGDCGSSLNPTNCMTTTSMALYDQSGNVIPATFSTTSNDIVINLTSIESVGANTTRVYRLEATLSGFTTSDSMSIRIKDETTSLAHDAQTLANAKVDADASAANEGPFVWSDNSGTYQSTTDVQWFVGRQVPGLDTTVQSHQFPS